MRLLVLLCTQLMLLGITGCEADHVNHNKVSVGSPVLTLALEDLGMEVQRLGKKIKVAAARGEITSTKSAALLKALAYLSRSVALSEQLIDNDIPRLDTKLLAFYANFTMMRNSYLITLNSYPNSYSNADSTVIANQADTLARALDSIYAEVIASPNSTALDITDEALLFVAMLKMITLSLEI